MSYICINFFVLVLCSRRWCLVFLDKAAATCSRGAMSGSGLRRAGTGRCYLPGRAAWWGIWVTSSNWIFFGGGRMGHARCRGNRPPRRWYVVVSERRTSTSVATCICWTGYIPIHGRFFRGFLNYHVSYDPVRVPYLWTLSAHGSALRGSGPGRR